jgi:hypothetical protein
MSGGSNTDVDASPNLSEATLYKNNLPLITNGNVILIKECSDGKYHSRGIVVPPQIGGGYIVELSKN